MARKVKFPLELRDGYLARSNIEEVREHFDLEKIIAQFHNGRLKIWLEDHYLSEMAEQVAALDGDAPNLAAKLCAILGVEGIASNTVDSQAVRERERKLQKLRQCTSNERYLNMVEYAAFDQKDLDDVLNNNPTEILLCGGEFHIPLVAKQRTYYGVGNVVAVIDSERPVDFEKLGIRFINVDFDETYEQVREKGIDSSKYMTPEVLAELCSVLILGDLKDRRRVLDHCNPFWKDGFTYQVHPYVSIPDTGIGEEIANGQETIIGYGKAVSMMAIVFTDRSLYVADYNEPLIHMRYADITRVLFASSSTDRVFQIDTQDGSYQCKDVKLWDECIGFFGVRLFLLIMARIFGSSQYKFTESELYMLSQVRLDSLNDKYITELL
ncbi:hypothetical protein [Selenomonas sp.]|uniref:hypothetical protein n=1 Tax=Selenomonas sp. TaxID=2053611 RepID=UPI001CB31CF8|nr:hypothetical protein [Selenomonas sp.]MBF1693820.1 hypothetical protein [Selenomonas sp.]